MYSLVFDNRLLKKKSIRVGGVEHNSIGHFELYVNNIFKLKNWFVPANIKSFLYKRHRHKY